MQLHLQLIMLRRINLKCGGNLPHYYVSLKRIFVGELFCGYLQ